MSVVDAMAFFSGGHACELHKDLFLVTLSFGFIQYSLLIRFMTRLVVFSQLVAVFSRL